MKYTIYAHKEMKKKQTKTTWAMTMNHQNILFSHSPNVKAKEKNSHPSLNV